MRPRPVRTARAGRCLRRPLRVALLALAALLARPGGVLAACGDGVLNPGETCDATAPGGDLACPGSCIPAAQPGACTCMRPSTDVRDYAIVGDSLVKLGSEAVILGGGVAARNTGGALKIGKSTVLPLGLDAVGDKTKLSSAVTVGRLFANQLGAHPSAVINKGPFDFATPVTLANLPAASIPTNTGANVAVADGGTETLNPGTYGELSVGGRGRLRLRGLSSNSGVGRYHFKSIAVGPGARIEADEPVLITVATRVKLGSDAFVGPGDDSRALPGDVQLVVGSAVKLGRDTTVIAYVQVTNGKLAVGAGGLVAGRLIAAKVSVGKGATVIRGGGCGNGVLDQGEQCDASAPASDSICPAGCIPGDLGDQSRIQLGEAGQCTCRCTSNADCSNGDACDGIEQCNAGRCVPGTPPSCDDGNPCTLDCDPAVGCVHQNQPDGRSCQDGSACTVGDECLNGVCKSGSARNCNDGNACTTDSCDPATGCVATALPDNSTCTDRSECTTGDKCVRGACVGTPLACDDGNPCTLDCDREVGCVNRPHPDGRSCQDGSACTVNDHCELGQCVPGPPRDCDDDNACTADSCNPVNGCNHSALVDGLECSDNSACTAGDKCVGGACVPGDRISCADGDPCTDDRCVPATGCVSETLPNGSTCNDRDTCTLGDTCQAGICAGATPRNCDDQNDCTVDTCDPVLGCNHVAVTDGAGCSDRNACTQNDTCTGGECIPGPRISCGDGNSCTEDRCLPATGCENKPALDGSTCNDGNQCTQNETCTASVCGGGVARNCADSNPCTNDLCDPALGCQHLAATPGTPCGSGKTCQADGGCR